MAKQQHSGILIDDEKPGVLQPTTDLLKNRFKIDIEIEFPKDWNQKYINYLSRVSRTKDFIILDWKLDHHTNEDAEPVPYRGSELSQLIRRKTAEKLFRPVPIFLWSTDNNLKDSYNDDFTSHDLFDRLYTKDKDLTGKLLESTAIEMKYFIHLYRFFRRLGEEEYTVNNLNGILGLTTADRKHWLDRTASNHFVSKTKIKNVSKVAKAVRIVFHEIIKKSGPLIDERLLGVRLGLDIDNSKDWHNLLKKKEIVDITYNGFFSNDSQPRFWMQGLYELWDKINPAGKSLIMTPREEKVALLSKKFRLPGLKQIDSNEKQLWYLNRKNGKPLDPNSASLVHGSDYFPWQDPLFEK